MSDCPGKHRLPHKGTRGFCTLSHCGDSAKPAKPVVTVRRAKPEDMPPPTAIARGRPVDLDPVSMSLARAKTRLALVPVEVVPPEDVEVWTQKKAVSLLPGAMAEVEYQMRFGDDKQRIDAARDVLDMTGNRKRDALGGGGNTIILNLSQGDLPWLKRAVPEVVAGGLVAGGARPDTARPDTAGPDEGNSDA